LAISIVFFALGLAFLVRGYGGDASFVTFGAAFVAMGSAFAALAAPPRRRRPR